MGLFIFNSGANLSKDKNSKKYFVLKISFLSIQIFKKFSNSILRLFSASNALTLNNVFLGIEGTFEIRFDKFL